MIDVDRLRQLADQGKGDREIADVLGVSRQAVAWRRTSLGLRHAEPKFDVDRLRQLVHDGKTDAEIGRVFGFSRQRARYQRLLLLPRLPARRDLSHEAMWTAARPRSKRRVEQHQLDEIRSEFLRGVRGVR